MIAVTDHATEVGALTPDLTEKEIQERRKRAAAVIINTNGPTMMIVGALLPLEDLTEMRTTGSTIPDGKRRGGPHLSRSKSKKSP